MGNAKSRTLAGKALRCVMALCLAASALLVGVTNNPQEASAKSGTVNVTIGDDFPYAGYMTTWMQADGQIAYCADPDASTPAAGTYSTSAVPNDNVKAAIWYAYGSPGFDKSMFPSTWYDGSSWTNEKYAAASHVIISYAYQGSKSAATYGTTAAFDSWADDQLLSTTWNKMKAGVNKVSSGFDAFCVKTGPGTQVLVSFSWSKGGVKVAKEDAESGNEPQGDAALEGATFNIVNATGGYVLVDGKYYADDEACASISAKKVDGKYVAQTSADKLPVGKYRIVESGAPTGYLQSSDTTDFSVKASEVADLTGDPVKDKVIRGGVKVVKADKELKKSEALGGAEHSSTVGPNLNGIEFTVVNKSAAKVLVDGTWYEPGEVVATMTTAWNEGTKAYTAQTSSDALPYGTYTVQETATNGSYLLTDGEAKTFEVREDGKVVEATTAGDNLTFYDQVIRNDLEISKKAESSNASLQVPFVITNVTTGEGHVLVTDRNGNASTAASWNKHSANTNGNDALLKAEGIIATADMDAKAGVWFALGEDGSEAAVDDTLAAMPYGVYTLTELRCEANEGLELITKSFWIERDSTVAKAAWMSLDDQDGPKVHTTAADGQDGDKNVSAEKQVKIVDTVAYEDLDNSKTYELVGTLMDKVTKEALLDEDGNTITSTVELTPAASTGTQDVEFTFDASLLGGHDVVVFESLRHEGVEVAAHADIDDEGQTVHVDIEIGTKASDASDGDQIVATGKVKLTDIVSYKGLTPGADYVLEGTLMDKQTGEPFLDADGNEVKSHAAFKAEKTTGEAEVTFEFDAGNLKEGDELVVFEKLLDAEGNVVATHEDLESTDQTVVVDNPDTPETPDEPYAKTGADAPDNTGYAVAAGIALAVLATAGGVLAYRKRKGLSEGSTENDE